MHKFVSRYITKLKIHDIMITQEYQFYQANCSASY